jgi:hypothetical protein
MTWQPGRRAGWVRLANAGVIDPIAYEAGLPFDRDELLGEARARAGVDGREPEPFGDDGFLEPFDLLLRSLEGEADLTVVGRWMTRRFLLRLLQVRLQMAAYLRADPGVLDEPIDQPLAVTGLPRTGTTLLHAVLARDPGLRAPRGWELLLPVPPPDPSVVDDGRVPIADAELRMLASVVPSMDVIHEYGARLPKECLSAHSFEFQSEEFTARYAVPAYEKWLLCSDMAPAYRYHRLVLQVLQRRTGPARWVLKSPVHLHSLPTMLSVYPDVRVVVTHRDPLTVLGSAASLVANLRWVHSDTVDFAAIGRQLAARYAATLDRLVDLDVELHGTGRLQHVHYPDVASDLVGVVRPLYAALDLPMSDVTLERMRTEIAARPKDKHGAHEYSFDDVGLDRTEERERFARYCTHFGVSTDGNESTDL